MPSFFLAAAFLQAPDLALYVAPAGERTLVYRAGETELRMELVGGARGWTRSWSDGRSSVERFEPEAGLLLLSLALTPDDALQYERPVILLPPRLEVGAVHESQRRFVRRKDGSRADVGAHAFEVEILGFEDVMTPLRQFDLCLKLRRLEVRMDFSGSQERYEAVEWYAIGVGMVKSNASRTVEGSEETIDLLLVSVSEP